MITCNKQRSLRAVLNFAFIFLSITTCFAQTGTSKTIDNSIEEYLSSANSRGHFSGAVLIAKDGKIILDKGYGMANYEEGIPAAPNTKFRLASLTKQFTAMAIMILQEKGKINVQDPVSKYLNDPPPAWNAITIYHLLTHTSGIPDLLRLPGFEKMKREKHTPAELIEFFKNRPLDFVPGENFTYSNSGYILLGYIIEKITGSSYSNFLRATIFEPLGMKDTGFETEPGMSKQKATGYYLDHEQIVSSAYVDMTVPFSAGGLYSTVEDLYKWDQALYTEKLVSKKSRDAMFTPYRNNYGFGFVISRLYDRKFISHSGSIEGFATYIARYPDDRVTIIVLNNVGGSQPPVGRMAINLAAILFGNN